MQSLNEIIDNFADLLILESELGNESFDFDRSLLLPPIVLNEVSSANIQQRTGYNQQTSVQPKKSTPAQYREIIPDNYANTFNQKKQLVDYSISGTGKKVLFIGEKIISGLNEGALGDFFGKVINAMGLEVADCTFFDFVRLENSNGLRIKPTSDELTAVNQVMMKEIKKIKPQVAVLFGDVARASLLPGSAVAKDRWYLLNGVNILSAIHPADVLRYLTGNEEKDKKFKLLLWRDMQAVKTKL